jgi:hypothetical protein
LHNRAADVPSPTSHTTKAEAIGKATCMQGYVARLGLGMTRIRNQRRERRPMRGSSILVHFEEFCFMTSPQKRVLLVRHACRAGISFKF